MGRIPTYIQQGNVFTRHNGLYIEWDEYYCPPPRELIRNASMSARDYFNERTNFFVFDKYSSKNCSQGFEINR